MKAQVLFRVKCSTELSKMVRIVGNNPQLRNWNPGFKLITNNEIYPIWYSDYALEVELNQLVEFKLIITYGLQFILGMRYGDIYINIKISYCFNIYNIKRKFQILNLNQINILESTRKVFIQLNDKLYDSNDDSDSEQESNGNSLLQDEII
ncbi:unnamed protein product [Paramecium sonneborni]|uniref:CBM20 domain-containing protein n=1 Tax=Paramecium sonneborni TaxID=65129 RepID=A0A8S1RW22_9CILI|nr:unnamed protein product [Paramecium sonneborni]